MCPCEWMLRGRCSPLRHSAQARLASSFLLAATSAVDSSIALCHLALRALGFATVDRSVLVMCDSLPRPLLPDLDYAEGNVLTAREVRADKVLLAQVEKYEVADFALHAWGMRIMEDITQGALAANRSHLKSPDQLDWLPTLGRRSNVSTVPMLPIRSCLRHTSSSSNGGFAGAGSSVSLPASGSPSGSAENLATSSKGGGARHIVQERGKWHLCGTLGPERSYRTWADNFAARVAKLQQLAPPQQDHLLVFTHIPKCGGSSFRNGFLLEFTRTRCEPA